MAKVRRTNRSFYAKRDNFYLVRNKKVFEESSICLCQKHKLDDV